MRPNLYSVLRTDLQEDAHKAGSYLLAFNVRQSDNQLLNKDQVLGQHQAVLLHHRLQAVVIHQVVKHFQRGFLMLQHKQTYINMGMCMVTYLKMKAQ